MIKDAGGKCGVICCGCCHVSVIDIACLPSLPQHAQKRDVLVETVYKIAVFSPISTHTQTCTHIEFNLFFFRFPFLFSYFTPFIENFIYFFLYRIYMTPYSNQSLSKTVNFPRHSIFYHPTHLTEPFFPSRNVIFNARVIKRAFQTFSSIFKPFSLGCSTYSSLSTLLSFAKMTQNNLILLNTSKKIVFLGSRPSYYLNALEAIASKHLHSDSRFHEYLCTIFYEGETKQNKTPFSNIRTRNSIVITFHS